MLFRFCFNLASRFRGLVYNVNLDKYFSFMKGGHRSKIITHFVTKGCIEYTSQWVGIEILTLMVLRHTYFISMCKSNYSQIVPLE